MKVKSLSCVRLLVIPWKVVYQASLSMGFSRQEYWNGWPFPSLGDLPDPGLLYCRQKLYPLSHQGSLYVCGNTYIYNTYNSHIHTYNSQLIAGKGTKAIQHSKDNFFSK